MQRGRGGDREVGANRGGVVGGGVQRGLVLMTRTEGAHVGANKAHGDGEVGTTEAHKDGNVFCWMYLYQKKLLVLSKIQKLVQKAKKNA